MLCYRSTVNRFIQYIQDITANVEFFEPRGMLCPSGERFIRIIQIQQCCIETKLDAKGIVSRIQILLTTKCYYLKRIQYGFSIRYSSLLTQAQSHTENTSPHIQKTLSKDRLIENKMYGLYQTLFSLCIRKRNEVVPTSPRLAWIGSLQIPITFRPHSPRCHMNAIGGFIELCSKA